MLNGQFYDYDNISNSEYSVLMDALSKPHATIGIGRPTEKMSIPVRNIESVQIVG